MVSYICVQIGLGNGLLTSGIKPMPEPDFISTRFCDVRARPISQDVLKISNRSAKDIILNLKNTKYTGKIISSFLRGYPQKGASNATAQIHHHAYPTLSRTSYINIKLREAKMLLWTTFCKDKIPH